MKRAMSAAVRESVFRMMARPPGKILTFGDQEMHLIAAVPGLVPREFIEVILEQNLYGLDLPARVIVVDSDYRAFECSQLRSIVNFDFAGQSTALYKFENAAAAMLEQLSVIAKS